MTATQWLTRALCRPARARSPPRFTSRDRGGGGRRGGSRTVADPLPGLGRPGCSSIPGTTGWSSRSWQGWWWWAWCSCSSRSAAASRPRCRFARVRPVWTSRHRARVWRSHSSRPSPAPRRHRGGGVGTSSQRPDRGPAATRTESGLRQEVESAVTARLDSLGLARDAGSPRTGPPEGRPMRTGADTANRIVLFLLGLLLVAVGGLGLALSLGAFEDWRANSPVLHEEVHTFPDEQPWFWWAVVGVALLTALLARCGCSPSSGPTGCRGLDRTTDAREGYTTPPCGSPHRGG